MPKKHAQQNELNFNQDWVSIYTKPFNLCVSTSANYDQRYWWERIWPAISFSRLLSDL